MTNIYNKLLKLQKAHKDLVELWNTETEKCNRILSPKYPFKSSFNELQTDVDQWVNNTNKLIQLENEKEKKE